MDLSNCDEYVQHAAKYRAEKIQEYTQLPHNPTLERFSPSSIVKRGNIIEPGDSTEHISSATSEPKLCSRKMTKTDLRLQNRNSRIKSASQAGLTSMLTQETKDTRHASYTSHVKFSEEQLVQPSSEWRRDRIWSEAQRTPSTILERDENEGSNRETVEDTVGVGVYMIVDKLYPGQCFVSIQLMSCNPSRMSASKRSEQCAIIRKSRENFEIDPKSCCVTLPLRRSRDVSKTYLERNK